MNNLYTLNVFDNRGRLVCAVAVHSETSGVLAFQHSQHFKPGYSCRVYDCDGLTRAGASRPIPKRRWPWSKRP